MRMCRPLVMLCAAVALLPVATSAGQAEGIRDVSVSERSVIPLTTRVRYTTMVVLPPAEEILDIVCGDKDYWIISAAQNVAHIKPAREGASTNLNLVTASGAIYSFTLAESRQTPPDLKVYVTGDTSTPAASPRYYPAAQIAALQVQVSEAFEMAATAQREAEEAVATFKAQYPASLQFVYRVPTYTKPFFVRAIWHDGAFTYIRADARELPAVYEVVDGRPALVEFQFRHGVYTIPKVLDRGYLALGKARLSFAQER
jgi:type IV secretion system protein VirB9